MKCKSKKSKPAKYSKGGQVKSMKARGGGAAKKGLKFTRNG